MRIAVCISGQPRAYKQGYEYLKRNLLSHFDCDIFIHTWHNKVYRTMDVIKLYKPVEWLAENPLSKSFYDDKFTNTPNAKGWPPHATVSMFYSAFQSLLLKTKHELAHSRYDWIIKTRFDYAINGVIPFNTLDVKQDAVYIPNCRMVPTHDFGNDQFAFGNSRSMTEYMSTYLYMQQYYDAGEQMIGENMMSANLKRAGLVGPKLIYVNMNNPFLPGPYNATPHSLIRDDTPLWKNS